MIAFQNKDEYIATELSQLETTLKVLSSINKNDSVVELEEFVIPIFDIYFSTKFIDLNKEKQNYPGVDLYSREKKIAIQVTVETSAKKKIDCLKKVKELIETKKLEVNELYIFVLTSSNSRVKLEETNYFSQKNILNIKSILTLPESSKEEIYEYIQSSYKKYFSATFLKYRSLINSVFVETEVYKKALINIRDKHVLILNGNAGTGKTLTSYKVLFDYLEMGYLYLDKLSNLADKRSSQNKFILFIDDAIAPTDVAEANFERIQEIFSCVEFASDNLKIILNSRTNIINTFDTANSRFNLSKYKKFFVSADNLNDIEKFRILKKHIEKSFNKDSLGTLFSSNEEHPIYKIIRHKKYNPRIIERFKHNDLQQNKKLVGEILWALNNPDYIYNEQYKCLKPLEKEIMEYIAILGGMVTKEQLDLYFKNVLKIDLSTALVNLDNSFLLQSELDTAFNYTFYNPSIRDFCVNVIKAKPNLDEFFNAHMAAEKINLLLGYENITDETKISVISEHSEKNEILKNATTFNSKLYENFKEELIEYFIDDSEIPYYYESVLTTSEKDEIENKFDDTKVNYLNFKTISNFFIKLLKSNSSKLLLNSVQEKINKDYKNKLESYIYDKLYSYFKGYENTDIEKIECMIDSIEINSFADDFQHAICYDILEIIKHDDLDPFFNTSDSNFIEALLFLSCIKDDIDNVYNFIDFMSKENLESDMSSDEILDYYTNIFERDDTSDDDLLDNEVEEFRAQISSK